MKKLMFIWLAVMIIISLAACSNNNAAEEEPQFLDVKLSIKPEKAKAGEPVVFEAKVTYGEEEVTDADEVKFEIWRANAEEHEKVHVEHAENGIYRLEKSFKEEGTYYIYSHVTAHRMHNMPKKEFVIGRPSPPENESGSQEENMDDNEHGSH
ncbi:FixH family protein [Bacillus sp. 7894-2]|uniref:FixH family protein n=1 Tax=Bacillus sp. 7894-2 TaxID=2021695 RepID=UPI000BA7D1FC|nr:FixH family protein [Bacillus sp. 7894-2]PAE22842.1 hypothetical protein CHI10_20975 [Bacillus sp. 7894-2]